MNTMRYISLFSGIEAASVAWSDLGWEPVAFSEIEPFCCELLKQRYPNVPNLGDITKVDWEEVKKKYGSVDLIVGGSPCQSFSIAGSRTGLQGQSGLMYEFLRAVEEVMPRWVLWENVPGALSAEGGYAFNQLLCKMDELGFCCAWRVLDAQFFGVAQRRERLFLVGSLGNELSAEVLFDEESLRGNRQTSKQKRKELAGDPPNSIDGVRFDASCGCLTPYDGQAVRVFNPYSSEPIPTLQTACADSETPSKTIIQKVFSKEHRGSSPDDATTWRESDCACTLNLFDIGEARANEVICMTDTQPNTMITSGGGYVGALTRRCFKDPPVVCMGSDAAKSSVDFDVCGTLHLGGGRPFVVIPKP